MIESQPNISQQPIQFERKPPKKPKNSPKIVGQLLKLKPYMRYLSVTLCLRPKRFIVKILIPIKFR